MVRAGAYSADTQRLHDFRFHREVEEICALLRYYGAYYGKYYRLLVPALGVVKELPLYTVYFLKRI